jgi:hypothetical protein
LPNLELGPDDYRVRSKGGRWVNRDATYTLPIAIVIGAAWVGFAWWYRSELSTVMLVSSVGAPCLFVGMALGAWLKRFD